MKKLSMLILVVLCLLGQSFCSAQTYVPIGYKVIWDSYLQRYIIVTNYAPSGPTVVYPPVITIKVAYPPTMSNSATAGPKSQAIIFDPLTVDTDNNFTNLFIVSVNSTNGTAFVLNGTNIIYTPVTNYIGTVNLSYQASDSLASNTATLSITLTNRPPIANPIMAAGIKNLTNTTPVTVYDSDPDGDYVWLTLVTATNGFASIISPSNSVAYIATNNFVGTNNLTYVITDGYGGYATSTIACTIANTNYPPVAGAITFSGAKAIQYTVPVLTNASDPNGYPLSIFSVSPTNGTAVISGTNVLLTSSNFVGTTYVKFIIQNTAALLATNLITMTVTDRPPVLLALLVTNSMNTSKTVSPLLTATDPDNDPRTLVSAVAVAPTNGTVTLVGTNVTLLPTNGLGSVNASYSATDGWITNSAAITLVVTDVPPVILVDNYTSPKSRAITDAVLTNDSSPVGNLLTIVSVTGSNGTPVISGTNVVFTPTTNYIGTTHFTYTVSDGYGGTNSATDPIVYYDQIPVTVNYNITSLTNTVNVVPVLSGCSDPDGDTLTLVGYNQTNCSASISGTNLIVVTTSSTIGVSVGYTVSDGFGGTNTGVVIFNMVIYSGLIPNMSSTNTPGGLVTYSTYDANLSSFGGPQAAFNVSGKAWWASNFDNAAWIEYQMTNAAVAFSSDGVFNNGNSSNLIVECSMNGSNWNTVFQVSSNQLAANGNVWEPQQPVPTNFPPQIGIYWRWQASTNTPPGSHAAEELQLYGYYTSYLPVAVTQTGTNSPSGTVLIPALVGDYSPYGSTISLSGVGTTTLGTLSLSSTNIQFISNGTIGTNTTTYSISDTNGITTTTNLILQVH